MKKITTSILSVIFCTAIFAQDDLQKAAAEAAAAINEAPKTEETVSKPQYWFTSADFNLGFNQTALFSWAAGGYNTLSLAAGIDAKANYAKELLSWNNRLQLDYGFLWSADKENLLQKSNDRIYLESKFAYRTGANSKWNYTASFDFRSQFTDSYDSYVQDEETKKWSGTLKSGFLSPAYTNVALGMEWSPAQWFNVNLAPVTGGFTIVSNPSLRKNYGMKPVNEMLDGVETQYRSFLFQFGAQIKMNLKASLNDVLTYDTQLVVFTDYLNKPFVWNRVNWDNKLSWKAARFFTIALNTWLIYDPLVSIENKNGEMVQSLVQFKEFLAINFTYTISNKKN